MPVYQYACTECGEELEVRQSFTDEALTVCPTCSGRLRKVLSAVGVVFKGSGFYRNDSRADARAGSSNGDGSASSESSGSGREAGATGSEDKKGDGKSDAATPTKTEGSRPSKSEGGSAGSNGSTGTGSKPTSTTKAPAS